MDDARKPAETSTSPEVPHECNPKNGYLRAGRVRSEFSFSWQRDTDNPAAYLSECTKTIVSAPLRTSSLARNTDFFAGHPPQLQKPTISMSSVIPSKTPFLSLIILKSVVPGQKSSVCIHRIIPTFISIHFINFEI